MEEIKHRGITVVRRACQSVIYDSTDGKYSIQESENGFNMFTSGNDWVGEYRMIERAIDAIIARSLRAAVVSFPQEFGLRAFPGDVFTVSPSASYYSDTYGVQLYTQVKRGNDWVDFCKGTPSELASQMVRL